MKKIREKRIKSVLKQIEKYEEKIEKEDGRKDTTKDYVRNPRNLGFLSIPKLTQDTQEFCDWQKEIDEKFLKQIEKDEKYLGEKDGDSDKESS